MAAFGSVTPGLATPDSENTFPITAMDASAVLAMVLSEEEGPDVEAVITEISRGNGQILVPSLFWFEVMNGLIFAFRRGRILENDIRTIEANLAQLPFSTDEAPSAFIMQRVREYALEHDLTFYDAAYLELSQRYNVRLKTKDKHLLGLSPVYPCIY